MPSFRNAHFRLLKGDRLELKEQGIRVTSKMLNSVLMSLETYVRQSLEQRLHMTQVNAPGGKLGTCSILATEGWRTAEKLLVIMHDQPGCTMGVWSRSLMVEHGLSLGSMLPFAEEALGLGYDVIIATDPTVTSAEAKSPKAAEKAKSAPELTSEDQASWVYELLVSHTAAPHVFLVGYGRGARLCKKVLVRSFKGPKVVTGMALVESVRLKGQGAGAGAEELAAEVEERVAACTCNWTRSEPPSGRNLNTQAAHLGVGTLLVMKNPGSDPAESHPAYSLRLASGGIFRFLHRLAEEGLNGATGGGMQRSLRGGITGLMAMLGNNNNKVTPEAAEQVNEEPPALLLPRTDSWSALLDKCECLTVDDFTLDKVLAKGVLGKVVLVRLQGDRRNRRYALKVLNKLEVMRRGYAESAQVERSVMCESRHPFIPRLRFSFQTGQRLYLVTDYYPRGNLHKQLSSAEPLSEESARFCLAQVVCALGYLHDRGIVHRDVKPENILVDAIGYLALTDLGISKRLKPGERTRTYCGTVEYLSPEQVARSEHDHAVDWWAVGVLLYEMVMGITPFHADDPADILDRIANDALRFLAPSKALGALSTETTDLITALLVKSPSKRLRTEADVRGQPFFQAVDWPALLRKEVAVPADAFLASNNNHGASATTREVLLREKGSGGDPMHRFTDYTFLGDEEEDEGDEAGAGGGGGARRPSAPPTPSSARSSTGDGGGGGSGQERGGRELWEV